MLKSIDIDDFLVVDDYIYTHGTKKVKLAKIDINSGNIIKIKTYKRESDLRNDKYEFLGGRLSHNANTQRIYLGLSNKPFKIESYDYAGSNPPAPAP